MSVVYNKISFSKSLLAGILAGIAAALLNLIYMVAYRDTTGFATAKIIMPLSIFIGFPIVLGLAGCCYYLIKRHLSRGVAWFIFFFLALLGALLLITVADTKDDGGNLFSGLRGLCLGMEIITCMLGAFFIPYLASHPGIYE
ncbi:MAG TPA: hypothetical protein VKR53_00245 [Puia sp.]|nr:hypothetical protein [Puia sp.]